MRVGKSVRIGIGVTALLVLPMLPIAILGNLGLARASGAWALAAIAATMATILASASLGARVAVALAIASALGYGVATHPWAAGLVMGLAAAAYGYTARFGITGAVVMAPIALGFTMAEPSPILPSQSHLTNVLLVGAVSLAAGLWGVLAGWIIGRKIPRKPPAPTSIRRSNAFAIIIGVITGVTMGIVSAFDFGHGGAWTVLTLLVVIQPYVQDTWRKSLQRLLGTALGFVIAFAAAKLLHAEWALYLVAVASMVVAVLLLVDHRRPYWQCATFLTTAIVLLEGTGGSVVDTDVQRLVATAIGGAVALSAVALTAPIYRRIAQAQGVDHY